MNLEKSTPSELANGHRVPLLTLGVALCLLMIFSVATPRAARAARTHTLTWTGRVDSIVDVYFRRGNSWEKVVSGRRIQGRTETSYAPLPQRNLRLSLEKDLGRGKVTLRQQPTRSNNYTAIVRVEDRRGGADRYRFTLRWND